MSYPKKIIIALFFAAGFFAAGSGEAKAAVRYYTQTECAALCLDGVCNMLGTDRTFWNCSTDTNPIDTTPAGEIIVPGTPAADGGSGIIKCGRAGQNMCKLCDLIVGINTIIQYGFMIAIIVALTFIVVGAVIYIVSAGNTGVIETAKGAMKNAAIGILIVFCAWLIINTSLRVLGARSDLGIGVAGWSSFTCQ